MNKKTYFLNLSKQVWWKKEQHFTNSRLLRPSLRMIAANNRAGKHWLHQARFGCVKNIPIIIEKNAAPISHVSFKVSNRHLYQFIILQIIVFKPYRSAKISFRDPKLPISSCFVISGTKTGTDSAKANPSPNKSWLTKESKRIYYWLILYIHSPNPNHFLPKITKKWGSTRNSKIA